MLFSKDELDSFLEDSRESHRQAGAVEPELSKLTRKDFYGWLDNLSNELKEQIHLNTPLSPKDRSTRIKRAEHDFLFFARRTIYYF